MVSEILLKYDPDLARGTVRKGQRERVSGLLSQAE
jgi:hypothetical protein